MDRGIKNEIQKWTQAPVSLDWIDNDKNRFHLVFNLHQVRSGHYIDIMIRNNFLPFNNQSIKSIQEVPVQVVQLHKDERGLRGIRIQLEEGYI